MDNKPLISVIVPIYKVEDYINRCINSILSQEYKNLEIILVDDGSPDKCGIICDSYAQLDSRIKVIHKENGGLSDARNAALDIMRGEYVTFIDSDDWVSKYYISNLYKALSSTHATISISGFENVFLDKEIQLDCTSKINVKEYSKRECLEKMFYQNEIEINACGKLYYKDLFKEIRYPVGKLYEDIAVTYKLIDKSEKIAIINNIDYYYFQRTGSIQYEKFNRRKLDAIMHMQEMINFVKTNYPELKVAVNCRYFSTISNILFQIKDKNYNKEKEYLWSELKKVRKNVLFNKRGRKKARIGALISYFGYNVMKLTYMKTQWRA